MWLGLRYAETKRKERDAPEDKTNAFAHGSILQGLSSAPNYC